MSYKIHRNFYRKLLDMEGEYMGIAQRINPILNYDIEIDLEKRINRNKALVFVGLFAVALALAGYYIGDRWFWAPHKNYYEKQIDNLKKLLRQNPGTNDIRAQLAMTSYLKGETAKAKGILRDILTKEPNNGTAALYLGLILSEQKEYKESIQLLNGYVKQNQGLETRIALLYLGRDYLAAGNYSLALKYLKIAAERDPGNPVVYYNLGQTYEKLNDKKNTIASYEKALKISNNYPEADEALKALLKK